MSRTRRLLALAAFAAALPASAAQAALTVGIADQQAASFSDTRLRALQLPVARLTVPWDAATSEPQVVASWLAAVQAASMQPAIAFQHLNSERCPSSPCLLPSTAQYASAVQRFVARFPQVRTYTTWNEGNHAAQPTADHPEAVAGYYLALQAACPACTIVAGDVVDSGAFSSWLRRMAEQLSPVPQLWGVHNYGDVSYGRTSGTDAVLAAVPGQVWVEEIGGLVKLVNAQGRLGFSATDAEAATAIDRAFTIAEARPRVTRMYVYQWRANATDRFDSGLARPDGTLRPSYTTLQRDLAALATTTAASTPSPTVSPAVTWSARWSTVTSRTLLVRVRCPGACSGTTRLTLRTTTKAERTHSTSLGTRTFTTTTATPTTTFRIRVTKATRRRARAASARALRIAASGATVAIRLARPK